MALKCVGKENGRYEVIANEETGLRKYVKANDRVLKLETWEEHILTVSSVTFDQARNPLLKAPQGRVQKVVLSNELFHPVEVKGEWLKMKWETTYGTGNKDPEYDFGWIKWRDGESLLVELFYFC